MREKILENMVAFSAIGIFFALLMGVLYTNTAIVADFIAGLGAGATIAEFQFLMFLAWVIIGMFYTFFG
jgi:uncharacterized membrane protein YesL